jgi:hypothetical protein
MKAPEKCPVFQRTCLHASEVAQEPMLLPNTWMKGDRLELKKALAVPLAAYDGDEEGG